MQQIDLADMRGNFWPHLGVPAIVIDLLQRRHDSDAVCHACHYGLLSCRGPAPALCLISGPPAPSQLASFCPAEVRLPSSSRTTAVLSLSVPMLTSSSGVPKSCSSPTGA